MGRKPKNGRVETHYFTDFRKEFGIWAGEQFLARSVNVLTRRWYDPFTARCLSDAINEGNKEKMTHGQVLLRAEYNFRTYQALEEELIDTGRCLECSVVEGQPHAPDCSQAPPWPYLKTFNLLSLRGEMRNRRFTGRRNDA